MNGTRGETTGTSATGRWRSGKRVRTNRRDDERERESRVKTTVTRKLSPSISNNISPFYILRGLPARDVSERCSSNSVIYADFLFFTFRFSSVLSFSLSSILPSFLLRFSPSVRRRRAPDGPVNNNRRILAHAYTRAAANLSVHTHTSHFVLIY